MIREPQRDQSLFMKQSLGPPVLIPEGGLNFPPAIWQVLFVLSAPAIAVVALSVPVLFIVWAICTIITFIFDKFDPPQQPPVLLYPPTTQQSQANENP